MASSAGQIITGATSTDALGLKVYMEIQEAFDRTNVFMNEITVKTIESGASAQFIIGGLDAASVVKTQGRSGASTELGELIAVNPIQMDERVITITDTVYDARRIDGKEEKIAAYDVRGPVTGMIGQVLARNIDTKIVAQVGLAAEAVGFAGNPAGGTGTIGTDAAVVVNTVIASGSSAKLKGDAIAEAIFEAAAAIRDNEVTEELVVAVNPTSYGYLVQSGNGVNADYTSGNGGFDSGKIMQVAGVRVIITTNLAAATNINDITGLMFTKSAVGMVNLVGLTSESNYDFNRFATLVSGRFAAGFGVLNPACACAIASAAQS